MLLGLQRNFVYTRTLGAFDVFAHPKSKTEFGLAAPTNDDPVERIALVHVFT